MLAFGERRLRRRVDAILPARYQAFRIGGSHAQRDIVDQTLIAAAERSGQWNLARALLAERVAVKPTARAKQAYERARRLAAGQ